MLRENKKIKILLISPYEKPDAIGLRIISSYLKQHGHNVEMIFLNLQGQPFSTNYSQDVVNGVIEICKNADLIGISLMTNHFMRVKDLTEKIKKRLNTPIIWGGIHPTVRPEECIKYADMVCLGEGEEAMLELANKIYDSDVTKIKNIWFKSDGAIIQNELRPLVHDLDKYPFPDYDLSSQYIIEAGIVVRMTADHLKRAIAISHGSEKDKPLYEYMVLTARNCPHNCTYCCNNALRKKYGRDALLVRKRDINKVIQELEFIKSRLSFLESVNITDETFFIRSQNEIEDFCHKYKHSINLPLTCNISPLEINEKKIDAMVKAGLFLIFIGIQSFNEKMLRDIYLRHTSQEKILKAVQILDKFKSSIPHPIYMFILDNPFETKESLQETYRFISSLQEGAITVLFPLVFFPGTELYERAKSAGLIHNEIEQVYLKDWLESSVVNSNSTTRLLYFQRYLRWYRWKGDPLLSFFCGIALSCRKNVLFYLFFLAYRCIKKSGLHKLFFKI